MTKNNYCALLLSAAMAFATCAANADDDVVAVPPVASSQSPGLGGFIVWFWAFLK